MRMAYRNSRNLKEGRIVKKAGDYRNKNDIKTAKDKYQKGHQDQSGPGQNRSHTSDKL